MYKLNKIIYNLEEETINYDGNEELNNELLNNETVEFYVSDETLQFIKEGSIEEIQEQIIDEIKFILTSFKKNKNEHSKLKQI